MFEGIHFKIFNIGNSSSVNESTSDSNTNQIDLHKFSNATDADFEYDSYIQYLPSIPVSKFTYENYLYIQDFGLLKSDMRYFTKRKDFSSYEILYTYQGSGYLDYDGHTYELKEGVGFFIDCRKPHFYRTSTSPWVHSDLHFYGHLADSYYEQFSLNGNVLFTTSEVPSYQYHLEKILQLYDTFPYHMELQISTELSQIVTELIVQTDKYVNSSIPLSQNLQYLQKYMQNNYSSVLTLDFLSEFSGISKYHLCREFKRYTGFTPNDYLIHLRLEQAKSLLITTAIPIYKIAQMVGIPNEDTFMYHFKKHVHTTPSVFRKKLSVN